MLLGAWRLHEQRPIINYRPVSKTRASSMLSGYNTTSMEFLSFLYFSEVFEIEFFGLS